MIDLKLFCSKDPERERIDEPYNYDEYTYATDGNIALRVPRDDKFKDGAKDFCPNPNRIFEKKKEPSGFFSLTDVQYVSVCASDFEWPVEQIQKHVCGCAGHDCPYCVCSDHCTECDGLEYFYKITCDPVIMNVVCFSPEYIRKILTLPNVKFQKPAIPNEPNFFQFDGGDGALMPLRDGAGKCQNTYSELEYCERVEEIKRIKMHGPWIANISNLGSNSLCHNDLIRK